MTENAQVTKTYKNGFASDALYQFTNQKKKWNLLFNHLNEKGVPREQKKTNTSFSFLSIKRGTFISPFPSGC